MREMIREIARVAEQQHGLITLEQARRLGCTSDAVWQRLRTGRWEAVAEGVYRFAGAPPTWEQGLLALTLAAGPTAAASHRSAAALLGIAGFERRGRPEVTSPRSRRHRAPGSIVHRWRPFPEHHLTVIEGIVSTRVPRTLVDLAGVIHPGRTERAVDNCLAAGVVTFHTLQEAFTDLAGRGRKGIAVMRDIIEARGPLYVASESELEDRFLQLISGAGLPAPVRQHHVGDGAGWIGRADFAYLDVLGLMEVDGRRYHSSLLDQEADARRDTRLRAAGWREILRFGFDDIVSRPDGVLDRVRRLRADAA